MQQAKIVQQSHYTILIRCFLPVLIFIIQALLHAPYIIILIGVLIVFKALIDYRSLREIKVKKCFCCLEDATTTIKGYPNKLDVCYRHKRLLSITHKYC